MTQVELELYVVVTETAFLKPASWCLFKVISSFLGSVGKTKDPYIFPLVSIRLLILSLPTAIVEIRFDQT